MNLILPLKRVKYTNEVYKFRFTGFIYRNTFRLNLCIRTHNALIRELRMIDFFSTNSSFQGKSLQG